MLNPVANAAGFDFSKEVWYNRITERREFKMKEAKLVNNLIDTPNMKSGIFELEVDPDEELAERFLLVISRNTSMGQTTAAYGCSDAEGSNQSEEPVAALAAVFSQAELLRQLGYKVVD